ncbi:MAG: DUF2796 domain-containing protein [Pseudomonadota bacterium]
MKNESKLPTAKRRARTIGQVAAFSLAPLVSAYGQSAHEHGTAYLRLAFEDAQVSIEFESPLANLVGFEHAPQNDEQRAALTTLTSTLGKPDQLVRLAAAAGCTMQAAADVQMPDFDADHHDADHHDDDHHGDDHHGDDHHDDDHDGDHAEHGDDDHHDDDHGGHSDEDHHDDNHAEHSDEDHGDEHSDVLVRYDYACASPGELSAVTLTMFDQFPALETVDAQAVGPNGFATGRLTTKSRRLDLTSL